MVFGPYRSPVNVCRRQLRRGRSGTHSYILTGYSQSSGAGVPGYCCRKETGMFLSSRAAVGLAGLHAMHKKSIWRRWISSFLKMIFEHVNTWQRLFHLDIHRWEKNIDEYLLPSVPSHCWLGVRKSTRPVKSEWSGTGMVNCLECIANDLHMVQLMPLPPIISCFSKIQNGSPFCWRLIYPGCSGKKAV